VRVDLTTSEIDLLMRLCSGCDAMEDGKAKDEARRLERYFRRLLRSGQIIERGYLKGDRSD